MREPPWECVGMLRERLDTLDTGIGSTTVCEVDDPFQPGHPGVRSYAAVVTDPGYGSARVAMWVSIKVPDLSRPHDERDVLQPTVDSVWTDEAFRGRGKPTPPVLVGAYFVGPDGSSSTRALALREAISGHAGSKRSAAIHRHFLQPSPAVRRNWRCLRPTSRRLGLALWRFSGEIRGGSRSLDDRVLSTGRVLQPFPAGKLLISDAGYRITTPGDITPHAPMPLGDPPIERDVIAEPGG